MRSLRHAALPLAALAFCTAVARAEAPPPASLYHRFDVGVDSRWARVEVPLRSEAWRVGAPDGPVASAEQLRAVLASLQSVVIGGRCAGANVDGVHYPCYLELAHPRIDGRSATDDAAAARWRSTSGETLLSFGTGVVLASSVPASDAQRMGAYTVANAPEADEGFLGLIAPPSFRAGLGAADGGSLGFEIRARSGPLSAATIESPSGLVILGTQPETKPEPAPQRGGRAGGAI